jgi:hypothetical protein
MIMTNSRIGRFRNFGTVSLALAVLVESPSLANDFGTMYVDENPNAVVFLNPDLVTWPNNQVEWIINTNNQISSDLLVSYIDQATQNFERHADLNFINSGETLLNLATRYDSSRQGTILIEVLNSTEMDSYVADINPDEVTKGSSFGGYSWIWWSDSVLSGQIALNADYLNSASCWRGIITHEFGHMLNLAHSDTRESIMFSTPYNSCEFQQTLRYDDINGLHQMYPEDEPNFEITITSEGCLYIPNIEFEGVNYQVRELCVFDVDEGSVIVNE